MRLSQFHCLGKHAAALELRRCQYDFRAEETENFTSFHAETFGHRKHQGVSFDRTHHGQPDTGIAAGGFYNGLPRTQRTITLGLLDDAQGHPVLHRCHGIERLYLDEHVDSGRRQAVDFYHRGVTYSFEYVVVNTGHRGVLDDSDVPADYKPVCCAVNFLQ